MFTLGNQHRPSIDFLSQRLFSQVAMKKTVDDEEESHVRTSSMSSTSAPVVAPPPLINSKIIRNPDTSANVKVERFYKEFLL